MKEIFFSLPPVYIGVMAFLYLISLRIIWYAATIVAKFMLKREQNEFWRPSEADLSDKDIAYSLTTVFQLLQVLIMMTHLIRHYHLWSRPLPEIFCLLVEAFVPLAILIFLSVVIVSQLAISHYLKKNLKR